jgi:imidazolonepropionase-like amidohydrolase
MIRRAYGTAAALALTLAVGAPLAAQTFAIQGGTIHTLTGEEPYVGTVVVRDGRILAVGPSVSVPAGAEVIDATGRHVYPGMFDAVTTLGLTEVGAVDVTNDSREQGDFNPHLQAATAIHPATEHIPVTRSNGITHAMAVPAGGSGSIAGQASLVGLDGWTVEEMRIDPGAAMSIVYPSLSAGGRGFGGGGRGGGAGGWSEVEERYRTQVARLDEWLEAGRHYAQAVVAGADVRRDLRLEAVAKITGGEMPVLLSANGERDIRNAVEWAERQNLRFVITGGREAWRIAEWLAERDVSVILAPTQSMPSGPDESYAEAYSNPGILHNAGVRIAFATFNSSDSRTLPYEAAMAVPFGLPVDAALDAVMKNGAEMLGLADDIGTIEAGKMGNVIVTDGNPLEIQTQVTELFILGRQVSLENRHQSLYERYRARPRARVIS